MTDITQTEYSTKTSSDQSIDLCVLQDAYHKLFYVFWGFSCVRDAGHRGNKITADVWSLLGIDKIPYNQTVHYKACVERQGLFLAGHI